MAPVWVDPRGRLVEAAARVQGAVVAVRRGEVETAGFLFSTQNLVATTFEAVAGPEDLVVIGGKGDLRRGHVVAWNQELDLALVQLESPLAGVPLAAPAACRTVAGQPIAALGIAVTGKSAAESRAWMGAMNLGHVALTMEDIVVLDVAASLGRGGPIVDETGGLVALVRTRRTLDGRPQATCAVSLVGLLRQRGKQGQPRPERVRGILAGMGVYKATDLRDGRRQDTAGAFISLGDRLGRFSLVSRFGVGSGWEQVDAFTFESRVRASADVEAAAIWQTFRLLHLGLGVGVALEENVRRRSTTQPDGQVSFAESHDRRLQPYARLILRTSYFEVGAALRVVGTPEIVTTFGLVFGL